MKSDNHYSDLIGIGQIGSGLATSSKFLNITEAHNKGLEVIYRGKFGATTVRSGVTFQNPVDNFNQRLALRASTLANLGITHDIGPLSYGANLRYVGDRKDYSTGEQTLSSYTVLDLTYSQKLNPTTKLFGRVENLFDERYETVYGYNQARFGLFVGVTWQPSGL